VTRHESQVRWLSQQGTRTYDNRDNAGIGARQGEVLGIVVDGSTNGSTNGEYARLIVEATIDWFVGSADAWSVKSFDEGTPAYP